MGRHLSISSCMQPWMPKAKAAGQVLPVLLKHCAQRSPAHLSFYPFLVLSLLPEQRRIVSHSLAGLTKFKHDTRHVDKPIKHLLPNLLDPYSSSCYQYSALTDKKEARADNRRGDTWKEQIGKCRRWE